MEGERQTNLSRRMRPAPHSQARRLAFELVAGARKALPKNHPDRGKYQRHVDLLGSTSLCGRETPDDSRSSRF